MSSEEIFRSISIHALLAESDVERLSACRKDAYFYPRSPCGERLLLLIMVISRLVNFYPRSPCGERHLSAWGSKSRVVFLSTLSLRRATDCKRKVIAAINISIHALLAESDVLMRYRISARYTISIHALLAESDRPEFSGIARHTYFYPRSPCGERLGPLIFRVQPRNFYPRSPCGERHTHPVTVLVRVIFLSTLSLRRATAWCISRSTPVQAAFLSTLSLRRATTAGDVTAPSATISIHALLAESDCGILLRCVCTLYFYPRSPCGERRCRMLWPAPLKNFYPRSPCGERHTLGAGY